MPGKRPKEAVSYNMSRIRSHGTKLEDALEAILNSIPLEYTKQPRIFGRPDFAYVSCKIAIFADSDFWHGFDWRERKGDIKTNKDFWIRKIERNMQRDIEVAKSLQSDGWMVIRLWGHEILKQPNQCRVQILKALSVRQAIKSC